MNNITVAFRKRDDGTFKAAVLVDGQFVDSVENANFFDFLTGAISQNFRPGQVAPDQQVAVRLDVLPITGGTGEQQSSNAS